LGELARKGVKRVLVSCPSFVADCLETSEEMGIRGRQTFIDAGGEELYLAPAPNAEPGWAKTVANWIREVEA
jgi:ferrochelatase